MSPRRATTPVFSLDVPSRAGRQGGRSAQRSGASFEALVQQSAEWYTERALAQLEQIPTATVMARRQLVYDGKAPKRPDFAGQVAPLAHDDVARPFPLLLDAKVTTGKPTFTLSFPDADERRRAADQVRRLRRFKALGGLAGFLCLDRDVGARGAVFWLDAECLAPFDSVAFVAGLEVPPVPIRTLHPGSRITSGHPWRELPTDADIVAGRVPPIPWRELVLPG